MVIIRVALPIPKRQLFDYLYDGKELAAGVIPVVTGFQGLNAQGDIATLGRGGSDTTAVAILSSASSSSN